MASCRSAFRLLTSRPKSSRYTSPNVVTSDPTVDDIHLYRCIYSSSSQTKVEPIYNSLLPIMRVEFVQKCLLLNPPPQIHPNWSDTIVAILSCFNGRRESICAFVVSAVMVDILASVINISSWDLRHLDCSTTTAVSSISNCFNDLGPAVHKKVKHIKAR